MGPRQLSISIYDLMMTFREALVALVPPMDKAMIAWREGESYDDWDLIAEALFKSFVESLLADVLAGARPLARYGFLIEDYPSHSFITVSSPGKVTTTAAFVRFATRDEPFDMVRVRILAAPDHAVTTTLDVPIAEAQFAFLTNRDSHFIQVEKVTVPI